MDPDDAKNWTRSLSELVLYLDRLAHRERLVADDTRDLTILDTSLCETLALSALSCENITQKKDLLSVLNEVKKTGIDMPWLAHLNDLRAGATLQVGEGEIPETEDAGTLEDRQRSVQGIAE